MNCPRCGDENYDSDRFCSTCGLDLTTYRNLWPQPAVGTAVEKPSATLPDDSDASVLLVPPAPPALDSPAVSSYLGWAAALVALCWPAFWAGIPALVYAGRVETRLAAGDLAGAEKASEKARTWCWVTFVGGLLLWAVALALLALL